MCFSFAAENTAKKSNYALINPESTFEYPETDCRSSFLSIKTENKSKMQMSDSDYSSAVRDIRRIIGYLKSTFSASSSSCSPLRSLFCCFLSEYLLLSLYSFQHNIQISLNRFNPDHKANGITFPISWLVGIKFPIIWTELLYFGKKNSQEISF